MATTNINQGGQGGQGGQGANRIPPPSEAYQQAIISPVYRLSELMFGSLLAAYVLGFVSFAAVYSNQTLSPLAAGSFFSNEEFYLLLDQAVVRAPFFFVSITYAYVTAGLYVSYHAGILTMHHMPLDHLSFDFALALSQALLFGVSMLYPMAFPFWLGVTLIFASLRQYQEHRQLSEGLFDELRIEERTPPSDPRARKSNRRKALKDFRSKFQNLIKEDKYDLLSGWRPTPKMLVFNALVLMLVFAAGGRLMVYFHLEKKYALTIVSFITCVVTIIYVHFILGRRANLLSQKMVDMDNQFNELISELQA